MQRLSMRTRLLLSLGAILLAGCAATSSTLTSTPPTSSTAGADKPARVNRQITVSWDHTAPGGAAMRQDAYVDALVQDDPTRGTAMLTGTKRLLSPEDIAASMATFLSVHNINN